MWYAWLKDELSKRGVKMILRNFPDPYEFRAKYWIPFMKNELKCDEHTVIVGHSAGTAAAMRIAEEQAVAGLVLVSAWYQIGDVSEEPWDGAGYCDNEWNWDQIKKHVVQDNNGFILQFHSVDDDFCDIEEAREISKFLSSEYFEFKNRRHFQQRKFQELLEALCTKLGVEL